MFSIFSCPTSISLDLDLSVFFCLDYHPVKQFRSWTSCYLLFFHSSFPFGEVLDRTSPGILPQCQNIFIDELTRSFSDKVSCIHFGPPFRLLFAGSVPKFCLEIPSALFQMCVLFETATCLAHNIIINCELMTRCTDCEHYFVHCGAMHWPKLILLYLTLFWF